MAFIDDLAKANAILTSGSKELEATQKQIQSAQLMETANVQARDIRKSQLKDSEKRAAFGALADDLTFSLAESGDPGMIQNILNRFSSKPSLLQSPEQAILQDAEDPGAAGEQILEDRQRRKKELLGIREDAAARAEQRKEGKLIKPTKDTLRKINVIDEQFLRGEDILKQLQKDPSLSGPIAGRVPLRTMFSGDFAKFDADVGRFFDQYRKAITGAQASLAEIAFLKTRVPEKTDTNTQFVAKMTSILKMGQKIRKRFLKNAKLSGQDVSALQEASIDQLPGTEEVPGSTAENIGRREAARGFAEFQSQPSLSSDKIKTFLKPIGRR